MVFGGDTTSMALITFPPAVVPCFEGHLSLPIADGLLHHATAPSASYLTFAMLLHVVSIPLMKNDMENVPHVLYDALDYCSEKT